MTLFYELHLVDFTDINFDLFLVFKFDLHISTLLFMSFEAFPRFPLLIGGRSWLIICCVQLAKLA